MHFNFGALDEGLATRGRWHALESCVARRLLRLPRLTSLLLCGILPHCLATTQVRDWQSRYESPMREFKMNSHGLSIASTRNSANEERYYFNGLLYGRSALVISQTAQEVSIYEGPVEADEGIRRAVLSLSHPIGNSAILPLRALHAARRDAASWCRFGAVPECVAKGKELSDLIKATGDESAIVLATLNHFGIRLPDGPALLVLWDGDAYSPTVQFDMRKGIPTNIVQASMHFPIWEARIAWTARKKPIYAAMTLLYPLAFVADVVFAPFEAAWLLCNRCQ